MQDLIIDKIELKVQPNESQYNFMRRALIKFAKLADFPPSEQLLFADTFLPISLNTPSFKLDWSKGDPSSDKDSAVKPSEFNNVRGKIIEFILSPKQKEYLKKRRIELIKHGEIQPNILTDRFSLYGFSDNGGYKLWHDRALAIDKKFDKSEIKNVVIPFELEDALRQLEVQTFNFATRFITEGVVRHDYLKQAKEVSEELLNAYMTDKITAKQGATTAHDLRNQIMEASRLKSSDIGRAYAESKKSGPRTLNYYEERYSKQFFKKPFSELTATQRNKVWLEIVKSSGRPNAPITKTAIRLNRLGKGLLVVTVAISVYNVATAENKVKATAKEGTSLLGGAIGGAAGGFVAGLACGPGAFVCVTLGVFIGGVAGALASDAAFDSVW